MWDFQQGWLVCVIGTFPEKHKLKYFPVWGWAIFTSPLAFLQNVISAFLQSCKNIRKALASSKQRMHIKHVTFWSLFLTTSVTIFLRLPELLKQDEDFTHGKHVIEIANSLNWSTLIVPMLSSLYRWLETAAITYFIY